MFTCTALRHALLGWQKIKGVPPKASKSKLKADRPGCSNYFNYKNDGGKNASCCTAMGHKLLISPGVAVTYKFLKNTGKTLPESYQQRGYKNSLATFKCQIQQAENAMPAEVTSKEAAHVDNAVLVDYLTSDAALEEPEIRSTDRTIPIENDCTNDELHFGMPWSSEDCDNEGDEIEVSDAIRTASRRRWSANQLKTFDLGTSDVEGYGGNHGDDTDVDEEEEASQADNGSTQNLYD